MANEGAKFLKYGRHVKGESKPVTYREHIKNKNAKDKALKGAMELARHVTQTSAKSSLEHEAKGERARIASRDAEIDKYFKKAGIK